MEKIMFISEKEFALKHNISRKKVIQMRQHIKGAKECCNCHHWEIPENSKPFFIPNKSYYIKDTKEYCYVMDAIASNMILATPFVDIPKDRCETIVRELKRKGYIVLINGRDDESLLYEDYMIAPGNNWGSKRVSERNALIIEILKTIQAGLNLTAACIAHY